MALYQKCGRYFTQEDIEDIKEIVKAYYHTSRCKISEAVCKHFSWYSENGKSKSWICREFLLELESKNILMLPPAKSYSFNRFKKKSPVSFSPPSKIFRGTLSDFPYAKIIRVREKQENCLWDHLVRNYHYLGYLGQVGRFLKYIVFIEESPVACIGWTGGALKVKSRDEFLNITDDIRIERIKYLANNFRFLILPWVEIRYLASHVLSRNARMLSADWKLEYGLDLNCLETFVERGRFLGTCYKASGWQKVGETKGYAKLKKGYRSHRIIKDVYVYPL